MDFRTSTGRVFHDFNVLYENAHQAVLESAKTSKSERSQKEDQRIFPLFDLSDLSWDTLTSRTITTDSWQVKYCRSH